MPQKKLATEILHREYAKALVNLALARADKLAAVKQAANVWATLGSAAGHAVKAFRGAKPAAKAVTPVVDAAATAAKPAAKAVAPVVNAAAPVVDAAATTTKPALRFPNVPLISAKQRAAIDAARKSGDPEALNKLLYNSPNAQAPAPKIAPTPAPAPKPAPTSAPAPAPAPASAPAAGGVPAPSAPVPAPATAGGNPATAIFDRWKRLTGLAGPRAGYVLAGNSVLHQGAQQIEENTGVPLTSNPVAGSLMFPLPTVAGKAGEGAVAIADAVFPPRNQPQADLAPSPPPASAAPIADKGRLPYAAGGPGGVAATGAGTAAPVADKPSSQFETFLANNNISSMDDVAKLSPELQAQFNTLAVDAVGANPKPEAPPPATPPTAPPAADKERLPYAAGGAGGVAATGAGTTAPVADKPQLTPEQQTAAFTDAETKLKTTTDGKAREGIIQDLARNMPNLNAGATAVLNGDFNSPEAQNFIDTQLGPAGDEFLKQQTAANPSDPTLFGQAQGMWESLGTPGQIAFAIGVPLTLLGILGGSGISTLLGALGLGVAGFAAATGGLFGETAQNAATDATAAVGVPTKAPEQIPFEYTPENASQILNQLSGTNTGMFANLGAGSQNSLRAFATANKPALETMLAQPAEELAGLVTKLAPEAQTNLAERLQLMRSKIPDNPKTPDVNETQQGQQKIDAVLAAIKTSMFNEKLAAILVMRKAARCWSGYEPVPGKKPYSNDSCRPIGGKKKKKKTEKKAVQAACPGGVCPRPQAAPQQPAQPQFSKTPFDRAYAEAAFKQHGIAYNPKATDQQLYNLYVNKGSVHPGKKMTPFQTTVGARHNYLRPAPLQPTVARPRVLPSTDIDPPSLTPAPAPSPFKAAPRPQSQPTRTTANAAPAKPAPGSVQMRAPVSPKPALAPFKSAPRPQSPPTSAAAAAPAEKPIHMRNPATLDAEGMRQWHDYNFRRQMEENQQRANAAPAKPAPPPKVR